ncbi:hypothetical protein LSAT2_017037 [Lamellibrachia satsuma]|nr:hypothetical protein LSAT2_017037 [Lamellibrachia satsuma]
MADPRQASGWPSAHAIEQVVDGSFHMVPVVVSDNKLRQVEWRYSVAAAEKTLAKHHLPAAFRILVAREVAAELLVRHQDRRRAAVYHIRVGHYRRLARTTHESSCSWEPGFNTFVRVVYGLWRKQHRLGMRSFSRSYLVVCRR